MPESSIVVRPEPAGTASRRLQAAGLADATAVFEQLAATVPLPPAPRPIVVADYGAATGYNSLLPIGAAIAVFHRRTRPDHAVLVAHTDLPDNDFTALFTTLAEDPDSYTRKDAASFPSAIGRSFYGRSCRRRASTWAGRRGRRCGYADPPRDCPNSTTTSMSSTAVTPPRVRSTPVGPPRTGKTSWPFAAGS